MSDISPFAILKSVRDGEITQIPPRPRGSESIGSMQIRAVLRALKEEGLLLESENGSISLDSRVQRLFHALGIRLTPLQHYYDGSVISNPRFTDSRLPHPFPNVFVLMPFLEELRPVYDDHIQTTIKALNCTCLRADNLFGAEAIINDIWSCIRYSDVIIADCTTRNPNVFYEIGIAHTLGKPVILISQDIDDVPFDLRHERIIIYKFTPKGMTQFENTLYETLIFEPALPAKNCSFPRPTVS